MGKTEQQSEAGSSSGAAAVECSNAGVTGVVMSEVQTILAEKRTALAFMRTGIAVFALPLSVFSVLIATSEYYDTIRVVHLLVPVFAINIALIALGTHLIVRAIRKIRVYDRMIEKIKRKHGTISEFIE